MSIQVSGVAERIVFALTSVAASVTTQRSFRCKHDGNLVSNLWGVLFSCLLLTTD